MPFHRSRLQALRNPSHAPLAKNLRACMTDAEARLWYYLRGGRFMGWKFRRQVPMGDYIVDFVCDRARVIVEIDGGQHGEQAAQDLVRTRWLEGQGYRVVRYWNNDVLTNIVGVLESLSPALSQGRGRKAERVDR
jgi:very-short-patch-repair endonuclease